MILTKIDTTTVWFFREIVIFHIYRGMPIFIKIPNTMIPPDKVSYYLR